MANPTMADRGTWWTHEFLSCFFFFNTVKKRKVVCPIAIVMQLSFHENSLSRGARIFCVPLGMIIEAVSEGGNCRMTWVESRWEWVFGFLRRLFYKYFFFSF
jgi:hypothetical protein